MTGRRLAPLTYRAAEQAAVVILVAGRLLSLGTLDAAVDTFHAKSREKHFHCGQITANLSSFTFTTFSSGANTCCHEARGSALTEKPRDDHVT